MEERDQLLSGSHVKLTGEAVLQAGMEAHRTESTAHTGPSSLGPPPTQDQPEKGEPAPSQAYGLSRYALSVASQVPQVPSPIRPERSWSPAPGRPLTTWLWPLLGWSSLGTDAPWASVTSR